MCRQWSRSKSEVTPMREVVQTPIEPADRLSALIESRAAQVGIVGLGYVGLPTAVEFAEAGFRVTGFEVDAARAAAVNAGRSHVCDVPDALLGPLGQEGKLGAHVGEGPVPECHGVNLCRPASPDGPKEPRLFHGERAGDSI